MDDFNNYQEPTYHNTSGAMLKKERLKKGLSFETIEKHTKIRQKYLRAIEEERWEEFPSRTYIQGIIHNYGSYLKLDEATLLAYFRREYEHHEEVKFKKQTAKEQFAPQTKKRIRQAIAGILLFFMLYFGYQLKLYFSPPYVTLTEPTQTTYYNENKIILKGQTEKNAIITINGKTIFIDENGHFEAALPLIKERNDVTVVATGANGKKSTITKTYIKKGPTY